MSLVRSALIVSLCVTWISGTRARAELHFDQLSQCHDLDLLVQTLHRWPMDCGVPRTKVEAAIQKQVGGTPGSRYCFLLHAPSPSLHEFDCVVIQEDFAGTADRTLACMRGAEMSDVRAYHDEYNSKYSAIANDYLEQASRCPVGNGDATFAVPSLLPGILKPLSNLAVGFVLPMGGPLVGNSLIEHGYAHIVPEVRDGGSDAIEYVTVYIPITSHTHKDPNSGLSVPMHPVRGTNWSIGFDDLAPMLAAMRQMYTRANLPLYPTGMALVFKSGGTVEEPPARRAVLDRFYHGLVDRLDTEGLSTVDSETLEREAGITKDQMRDTIIKSQPETNRASSAAQFGKFDLMLDYSGLQCLNNNGLVMSVLFEYYGDESEDRDYGTIAVILFSAGSCYHDPSALQKLDVIMSRVRGFAPQLVQAER